MELIQKIFDAGVVGAGGAGFPTHIKLNSSPEFLIINGAECEPLLETDKFLMRTKSIEVIRAMEEVGNHIKAEKLIIGLKAKYEEEVKQLSKAIEDLNSKVELFLLDNFYPAGDEQILVYEITKRSISAGGIPLDVGVVVSNVGTMKNIYRAINDKPVTDKYVSVIGEVRRPSIIKVPIGISVAECIEAAGGTNLEEFRVIMGGPMMGGIIHKDQIEEKVITKTVGALIVIPRNHYIVTRKETPMGHIINRAKSACIQCSMCTDLCPRYLIGHNLRPHRIMRSIGFSEINGEVLKEALICCECGICELYACPMGLSPRSVNEHLKKALRENGIKYEKQEGQTIAREMREYRRVPVPRLISRIDLTEYEGKDIEEVSDVEATEVKIPLSQHIGKPASPIVSVGDRVFKGQLIGKVEIEEFGANIHSSIDGRVCEVSEIVVIRSDKNEVTS
ncbi:SLBB domain-containing protein [Wukongibacter baidiensis]|uniref:4Fe-4S dicluster domain-containing protein n=1 Tax=Wukongibacter baidiensis TaxID=1723361 RepID=UPI003D7F4174